MYERRVDLIPFAQHRSLFLLGPRQTGKSTLLRNAFPEALYVDLLADEVFGDSRRPRSPCATPWATMRSS